MIKRRNIIIILLLLLMPFIVNAEECNTNSIKIESINLITKSNNVTEKSNPTVADKKINLDLKMSEVGDYIEYKMIIHNTSTEAYEINNSLVNASSKYIDYNIVSTDQSTIIKGGESKEVVLKVQYRKQVDENSFIDGVYQDNSVLKLNMSTDNNTNIAKLNNPKTQANLAIIILVVLFTIALLIAIITKKVKVHTLLLLVSISSLVIPISVFSLCQANIDIESKVEITKPPVEPKNLRLSLGVCRLILDNEYQFEEGMTIRDWIDSEYFNQVVEDYLNYYRIPEERWNEERNDAISELEGKILDYYNKNYVINENELLYCYDAEC